MTGRTHPPLPPDMLAPLTQIVRSPGKLVWVRRDMKLAEGHRSLVLQCDCKAKELTEAILGKVGVGMKVMSPSLKAPTVTVVATQWKAMMLGAEPIVARMLIGQCDACETIFWCTAGDWTPFLLLRFIVQNQAAAAGPKILVPGKGMTR